MSDTPKEVKRSLFSSLVDFINRTFPAVKDKKSKERSQRFDIFIRQVDKRSENYPIVCKAGEICDEALVVAKQRIQVIRRIHMLDEKMLELECYEKLSDADIETLKNLIERFLSLSKDKTALRFQITGFDKGLVNMEQFESEAKDVIKNMEDSEKQRKIFRQDINLLQGEKTDLEYQYEQMLNAQSFIKKLSVFLVVFFSICSVALAASFFINRTYVFFPISALCLIMILIIAFVFIFSKRIARELKLNLLRQKKTMELINKKNVVYVYHLNFLKFVYKKYNVRNSEKLKKNIKDYNDYKNITHRYDSIRSMMYETEYEIENFLKSRNISNSMITIEKFAKTVDVEDKRKVYRDYATEKARIQRRLDDLDKVHESIWADLGELIAADTTEEKIVERIIDEYTEEISKIAKINLEANPSEDGENAEDIDKELDFILKLDPHYKREKIG